MKQRKWDGKVKARIVLEGIKGRKVAEICNDYQISQAQYYQWRDQFLSNLDKPFEVKKADSKEELFWVKEWQGVKQIENALDEWVDNYNRTYLHSALGYKSPEWVEEHFSKEEIA